MVLNRCRDVVINLRQKAAEGERQQRHEEKVGWDVFNPSPLKQPKPVPYALDEPVGEFALQVWLMSRLWRQMIRCTQPAD